MYLACSTNLEHLVLAWSNTELKGFFLERKNKKTFSSVKQTLNGSECHHSIWTHSSEF